jgi:hypothetical protein
MREKKYGKKSRENHELELKKEKGKKITGFIVNMSYRKAAIMVGIGFLVMFFLALFADLGLLSSLVVPGDSAVTISNIKANGMLFGTAVACYIIILALDAIVALGLYVILKPVNKNLASLTATLRLLYTAIMGISLFALVLLLPDVYGYGKLVAYLFFIPHVFVLGYLVFKSSYIPRSLGVLLMIASFCFVILLYGEIILPNTLYEALVMIAMLPATFAEISLGIWLLVKGRKLTEMIDQNETSVEKTEAEAEIMFS